MKTIVGVFSEHRQVDRVAQRLQQEITGQNDISLLGNELTEHKGVTNQQQVNQLTSTESFAESMLIGMPNLPPLLVASPFAGESTMWLVEQNLAAYGVPRSKREYYRIMLSAGNYVLAVKSPNQAAEQVKLIMHETGATSVETFTLQTTAGMGDEVFLF